MPALALARKRHFVRSTTSPRPEALPLSLNVSVLWPFWKAVDAGGRRPGRQPLDRGVGLRLHVDAHDRDREADVEVVEDPVVEDERRDVGLDLQPERGRDDVAFEEEDSRGPRRGSCPRA